MRRLFLVFLFLTSLLFSQGEEEVFNTSNPTKTAEPLKKVLYLSFESVPKRILIGEIFAVTIKTLSTVVDFTQINYEVAKAKGLSFIGQKVATNKIGSYYYDTFYFVANQKKVKLPNFKASLSADKKYAKTTLRGNKLNVIALNPKKNFSGIIANSFKILNYKTKSYDQNSNILIFTAEATNSRLSAMAFSNIKKQGIESISNSIANSKISYYVVIDKSFREFSFSYFNLLSNKFEKLIIPILVKEDRVVAQSDLKPKNQSREKIKLAIAIVIVLLGIFIAIWRKRYIYLLPVLIPLVYIVYLAVQAEEVCIEEGSDIYLLPVKNSTIFETTYARFYLEKEGSVKNFMKVKLYSKKIGWVKKENVCKN